MEHFMGVTKCVAVVQPGQLYNAEDGRKALRDVFALGLFDNVQIFPKPNQKDESKVSRRMSFLLMQPFCCKPCLRTAEVTDGCE